ncbi:MAG: DUF4190 domain-containing protein [Pyrinomonadaceae bacterium]
MKKCPTCGNTFNDGMRFCQTDGTPLVEGADDVQASEPLRTVVSSNQNDSETETEVIDRMDTSISGAPPPSPFNNAASLGEPGVDNLNDSTQSPPNFPKFAESGLSSPSFGDLSSAEPSSSSSSPEPKDNNLSDAPLVFDSKTIPDNYSSGFDSKPLPNNPPIQNSAPIPSPFENPAPTGYEPPSYKEPEPKFGGQRDSFNQTPFDQTQTPFGNPLESYNPPMQAGEWTSVPAAPGSEWQDQGFGGNTQFQPPASAVQGQNQTLAIVSLVLGLVSIPCCGSVVLGLGAFITGFLAKKKADENPAEYGGRSFALAGMIIGGITTVIGIVFIILQVFLGLFNNI